MFVEPLLNKILIWKYPDYLHEDIFLKLNIALNIFFLMIKGLLGTIF